MKSICKHIPRVRDKHRFVIKKVQQIGGKVVICKFQLISKFGTSR